MDPDPALIKLSFFPVAPFVEALDVIEGPFEDVVVHVPRDHKVVNMTYAKPYRVRPVLGLLFKDPHTRLSQAMSPARSLEVLTHASPPVPWRIDKAIYRFNESHTLLRR